MNERKIYFAKMNDSVKIPTKRIEDCGYDIYANFTGGCIMIPPNEIKLIPTGLVSAFAPKWGVILKERGSTGTKGIEQRCGVIDSGFRGEWKIPITNSTGKVLIIAKDICIESLKNMYGDSVIIYPYSKAIAQAIVVEVPDMNIEEVELETILNISSERGTGMLGSSNK